MNRIYAVRYWTTISLASLFVAISYELRSQSILVPGITGFVSAIFSFFLGVTLAELTTNYLLSKKFIRKKIIGESWIEGYWLIKTDNHHEQPSQLCHLGILFLEYKIDKRELKAVTTRINENGEQFIVNSEMAFVREEGVNVKYLNYFRINFPGPGINYGMAFAEFSKNRDDINSPNILEGNIALEVEGALRRQSATKIQSAKVKELRKRYADDWIRHVLLSKGQILNNNETIGN